MTILIGGHAFHYEMECLCRVFFPYDKIRVTSDPNDLADPDGLRVLTRLREEEPGAAIEVQLCGMGDFPPVSRTVAADTPDFEKECERQMATALFELLCAACGFTPAWGILTGVRPIKLMRRLIQEEGSEAAARAYFRDRLLVSEEKTALAVRTVLAENVTLARSSPDSFSLYVSIPFCPTRCAYCSFVSMQVEKSLRLIPEYVRLLCEEIRETGKIAAAIGLRLSTIYFGGGTPTALSASELDALLSAVQESFDVASALEFTVEAGRPDTITPEKLAVLRRYGVGRISINPQTMHDELLRAIGRRHTTAQTIEAFAMAREAGFSNINMDLIAGLPGDTPELFAETLRRVRALDPESVTVHTLSFKRSSYLTQSGDGSARAEAGVVREMLCEAERQLTASGLSPYYLYRQSRTLGNFENVGWCKPGYDGLYNVFIMDETHTILAAGAGGVTKLREPGGAYIERIFNFKFPYEYNTRFEELLSRKKRVYEFYESYPAVQSPRGD